MDKDLKKLLESAGIDTSKQLNESFSETPVLAMVGRAITSAAQEEMEMDEDYLVPPKVDNIVDQEMQGVEDETHIEPDGDEMDDGIGIEKIRSLAGMSPAEPAPSDEMVVIDVPDASQGDVAMAEEGGDEYDYGDDGSDIGADDWASKRGSMTEEGDDFDADAWEADSAASRHNDAPAQDDDEADEFMSMEEPGASYDPTDELEPAKTAELSNIDPYTLIQKITAMQDSGMSSANAHYDEDRLMDLPIDSLMNVYKKVSGERVEEEDQNWGGAPGYQADSEGNGYESSVMAKTSPYKGGAGFPTGSASNAVDNIGNTGGQFKDNPIDGDVSESVDDIHNKLKESYAKFAEEYEELAPKQELRSRQGDQELDEYNRAAFKKSMSNFDKERAERKERPAKEPRAEEQGKYYNSKEKVEETPEQAVGSLDVITTATFGDTQLEPGTYEMSNWWFEEGGAFFAEFTNGVSGRYAGGKVSNPTEFSNSKEKVEEFIDPEDLEMHGSEEDVIASLGPDASMEDIAQALRDFESVQADRGAYDADMAKRDMGQSHVDTNRTANRDQFSGRDERGNYVDTGSYHPEAGTMYDQDVPEPSEKGSLRMQQEESMYESEESEDCATCCGTGKDDDNEDCSPCNGTGKKGTKSKVDEDIAAVLKALL